MSVYQIRFEGRWSIEPGLDNEPREACMFTVLRDGHQTGHAITYAARASFVGLVQHGVRNGVERDEADRRARALLALHGRDVVVGFVGAHGFADHHDTPVVVPVDLERAAARSALLAGLLPNWDRGHVVVDHLDVME